MWLLVLSTLPHLLAFTASRLQYSSLIVCSTAASVAWHWHNEPSDWLFYLDYGLAAAWTAADLYYAATLQLPQIIYLNILVFIANQIVDNCNRNYYEALHSAWHLLSASKAVYVSDLIKINSYGRLC